MVETEHQLSCAVAQNKVLVKEQKVLRLCDSQAPVQKAKAIEKAVAKATISQSSGTHLKEKGVVSDPSRAMVRNLVQLGVPVANVEGAINAVSEQLGVSVQDSLSARTVSRIVLEGGVAAKLQLVHEIQQTDSGFTAKMFKK